MIKIRVGQGIDVHAFVADRPLIIGGVTIPHEKGLLGHSDADVLCHALCDALLGAVALGDIGHHFPDHDPRYAGIDSRLLLRHVVSLVKSQGWSVVNADMTIMAQAPKMAPHILQMRQNLSQDLGVDLEAINIKATTTEQLGFVGRQEGIAAQAICLCQQIT